MEKASNVPKVTRIFVVRESTRCWSPCSAVVIMMWSGSQVVSWGKEVPVVPGGCLGKSPRGVAFSWVLKRGRRMPYRVQGRRPGQRACKQGC